MGSFDAPGYVRRKEYSFEDFYWMIKEMADSDMNDIKNAISNSPDLDEDEKSSLLSMFPDEENAGTVAPAAVSAQNASVYITAFETWYKANFFYISLVQWIILFFIIIKISKN